ncbi:uncharacterized protein METZ01_LOCUS73456 [marine metagenome]|uniref:Uncharacterized protein n=1 Tax=marine metagenome TaxID=408172 RepID=A0A381TX70_9ZZZZ
MESVSMSSSTGATSSEISCRPVGVATVGVRLGDQPGNSRSVDFVVARELRSLTSCGE